MAYTILSATWGNEQQTSAVVVTQEVAAVAISQVDTPAEWANFQNWLKTNPVAPLPVMPTKATLSTDQKFNNFLTQLGMTSTELKAELAKL
jgi:hypothetical protein